jgi:hypothetical protein
VDDPATVNNGGSSVAFTFEGNNVISDSLLADVNWQNLLTLSTNSHGNFRYPTGSPINDGLHDIFLRAPNAAVVVVGSINDVDVADVITTVPEPGPSLLLASALIGIVLIRAAFTRELRRP